MSYDIKFRKRTIEYLESGYSYRETASVFGISTNTLNKWEKKYRATGKLEDAPAKTYFKKIDPEALKVYIEQNPEAYQSEIAKHFSCTQQSVFKALKRVGITRKKRPSATKNKIPKR